MKTLQAAVGKWYGILSHFGVDKQFLQNKHGPCPLCGGKDRYRWDDKDGTGSFFCSGCGAGNGIDLLMRLTGMDFKSAANAIDDVIGNIKMEAPKPKKDPRERLKRIAQGLIDMPDINPVGLYLRTRGVKPSEITQFHPALPYFEDGKFVAKFPAMIHLFRDVNGDPATYHVTYLQASGYKADVRSPKKVMPAALPLGGGAIQLCEPADWLGIAEGIETALAATEQTGIPCWAAYSANLLEQFVPPEGVQRVVIFGDNDTSFTGQASAYALAKRLNREGFAVEVRIPETKNTDWADQA